MADITNQNIIEAYKQAMAGGKSESDFVAEAMGSKYNLTADQLTSAKNQMLGTPSTNATPSTPTGLLSNAYDQNTINTVYEQQRRAGQDDAGIYAAGAKDYNLTSDQLGTAKNAFNAKLESARQWASGKSATEIMAKAKEMGLTADEVGMIFGKDGGTGSQVSSVTGYGTTAGVNQSAIEPWSYDANAGWQQKKKPQTPMEYGQTSSQLSYTPQLNRQVDATNETIEGRIQNLLGVGKDGNYTNPVVRQAVDRAMQQFAGRGLLNSSMAQQAAYEAAIAKAIEIAGPDAKTYFEQGRANQDASNLFARDNQNYYYDLGKIQAQGDQTIRGQNNQNAFTGSQQDKQNAFTSGENTANRTWQSGENNTNRTWQSGENATNRTWQSTENAANRNAQLQASATSAGASLQAANLSAGTQLQVAQMNRDYNQMANLSQTSFNLLNTFNTTVGNIATSDLTTEAKDKLIGQASSVLRGSMSIIGSINGDVNMGALFDSVFPPKQGA
jgi:hypothetical protein